MFDNGIGNDFPILMPNVVKKNGESLKDINKYTKMRQSSEYYSNKDNNLLQNNKESPS